MKGLFLFVFAAASAFGVFRCQQALDSRRGKSLEKEVLYLSDPEVIRRLSFGHASLIADFYWLRAVQYYGGKDRTRPETRYDLLEPLLKVAVSLDSRMILVYRFGAIFLSEPPPIGAGNISAALELLDEGIRQNPDVWILLNDKGFIYYWQRKDYRQASEWFFRASRCAGAPQGLEALAQNVLTRQGDIETAQQLWLQQYNDAANEKLKLNARKNLENLRAHQEMWTLEWVVHRFHGREQRFPERWDELIQKGWLKEVPLNPWGGKYVLNPKDGSVAPEEETAATLTPLPTVFKERLWSRLDQRQP